MPWCFKRKTGANQCVFKTTGKLSIWDIAAGALLVKEAGGFIGDFSGRDKFLETGNVVAGNEKVFKEILKTIHPHLTSDLQY
jgi:myo-inositol-1(or 4)-monophosphatase